MGLSGDFSKQKSRKVVCKMHNADDCLLCKTNEILKNYQKNGIPRKKYLQWAFIYYIIIKRGMTYDDVGGYQSQVVTDLAVNFHGECPNREFGRHSHLI